MRSVLRQVEELENLSGNAKTDFSALLLDGIHGGISP